MKKIRAFSLVEIVITVSIVVILSIISGPIYNSYSTKSKYAEGYLLLGTIKDAQMKWYSDKGTFLHGNDFGGTDNSVLYKTCYFPFFEIDARGNKYYTAFSCNVSSVNYGKGNKTFKAVVYAYDLKELTMICPEDGPTTIL